MSYPIDWPMNVAARGTATPVTNMTPATAILVVPLRVATIRPRALTMRPTINVRLCVSADAATTTTNEPTDSNFNRSPRLRPLATAAIKKLQAIIISGQHEGVERRYTASLVSVLTDVAPVTRGMPTRTSRIEAIERSTPSTVKITAHFRTSRHDLTLAAMKKGS